MSATSPYHTATKYLHSECRKCGAAIRERINRAAQLREGRMRICAECAAKAWESMDEQQRRVWRMIH